AISAPIPERTHRATTSRRSRPVWTASAPATGSRTTRCGHATPPWLPTATCLRPGNWPYRYDPGFAHETGADAPERVTTGAGLAQVTIQSTVIAKQVGKSLPWPSRRRLGQITCRTYDYVLSRPYRQGAAQAPVDRGRVGRDQRARGRARSCHSTRGRRGPCPQVSRARRSRTATSCRQE